MTVGDQAWMEHTLMRLLRIPSVSGNEADAQIEVEKIMLEAGATTIQRVNVDPERLLDHYGFSSPSTMSGMYSVVGTWLGAKPGPYIVLNGHIDTVEAGVGWESDPFASKMRDGRIFGLGSADMKAGLVSAIGGVARAAASGQMRGRVDVQSVPDEEAGGGSGSLACVDSMLIAGTPRPDIVIVCEPTSLRIATSQVGSRSLRFVLHGVEAHANAKHLGLSAVELSMGLAGRLLAWSGTLNPDAEHPHLPPRAVNVGRIYGGDGATKVAARCDMEVCITYHPADAEAVVDGVDSIVDRWYAEQDARFALEVTELHNVHPFATDEDVAVVRMLRASTSEVAPPFIGFPAGSDGRLFHDMLGVPAVIFGPGETTAAHRPNESVAISELLSHAEALERFITKLPTEK